MSEEEKKKLLDYGRKKFEEVRIRDGLKKKDFVAFLAGFLECMVVISDGELTIGGDEDSGTKEI